MRKHVTGNVPIFTLNAMTTTATSVVCQCEQLDTLLISGIWTATTAASTVNTWVSNDNVNWFDLGASYQASLNTLTGSFMFKITDAIYSYVKLIYTKGGTSSGTLNAWFKGSSKGA